MDRCTKTKKMCEYCRSRKGKESQCNYYKSMGFEERGVNVVYLIKCPKAA